MDSAEEALEEKGGELIVNDADNSSETQVAALENFISAGVDGIIVCAVDTKAVEPVIKEAKEAGIAVVCLTSKVDGYDAYIGADEYTLWLYPGRGSRKMDCRKMGNHGKNRSSNLKL